MRHGGRAMAGGRMPWWVWALLVWSVIAVPLGLVLGALLRAAEWRQSGRGCEPGVGVPEEPEEPEAGQRPFVS